MAQWGQGQPGYQYPVQTGFPGANPQFQQQNPQFQQQNPQFQQQNPQFQQQNPQFQQGGFGNAGLVPQQTGFPGQRMQGFQQPQQTGFQGSGFMQAQPTGFPAQAGNFQQQPRQAPPPPVPPLPTQFQQQNQAAGFLGLPQQQQSQANRFLSASPGLSGPGLAPQATGFPGRSGPLVPQMTGFVDPRLQMMSSTFMPMNAGSSFGAPAAPQLAPPQFNLQQSFQQHNQAQRGTPTPQMSWSLTKAEKKQYNDIFRSWDAQGTGFINGQTALEVFGASGLPKDDLARIWTLADIDDRGKLNIAEFHVAMGLIYRRLSGMPVPEQLPAELVPPSARDLDNSVDIVKDLLKHESRARSPSGLDAPISRLKTRSFNSSSSTLDSGRDATIYKHSDSEPPGGFYHPRSRHVNRDDVRARNEADSPSADLSDMKRLLANTAQMLDRNAEADASRTAEDEALDREMDDLKYRVKRVSEDLEYVSRGPKTVAKDQERRKLERELLALMHERVPEVERKIKARDERKEREKRQWARDRDRTNERFGRYDPKDESPSRRYDDRDRDRPYSRGGYDTERDRDSRDQDRGSYRDERSRSRDYERAPSPPPARSAPPPPPAPSSSIRAPPVAPPPRATPSPAPLKNMTAEERQAFTRAEAKRRIEARMAALGVTAPSASPTIDTSVEDRLQQEKKEAEEKAKVAEKQAEERERMRNERLESEKAAKDGKSPSSPAPPAAARPAPTPTTKASTAPAPTPTSRPAPPPAPKRAPAPPPPRNAKAPAVRTPVVATPPAPPAAPAPPPEPEVDPEEEMLRAREEAIRKQREARAEKLRQLEREEEEAARQEEERYQARLQALKAKSTPSPAVQAPAFTPAPYKAPTPPPAAPPAPPAPAVVTPAVDTTKSTNPFSRLIKEGAGSSATSPAVTPATNGSTNPWARSQPAPPPSAPNPPKSPVPAGVKVSYNTAPSSAIDDDWEDIKDIEDDDSSDDDELSGRARRENIARQLFGGILPASRPQSAAADATTKPGSSPSSPAPPAPPPPPTAPPAINPQATAPFAPPPPPQPPVAPVAPTPVVAASPGDMSGLMRSIQGGLKLRPAKTVDKSAPPVSGRVLGDTAPPPHINIAPQPATPPQSITPPPTDDYLPIPARMSHDEGSSRSSNRQSVGWFADRAADAGVEVQRLPSTNEEEEEDIYGEPSAAPIPAIHVNEPSSEDAASDIMADIDKTIEHRARTLYPYEGEGPDDLSFGENLVLTANPSKSGGDWWYGTLINSGKSGVFPKTYVQVVKPVKAKAIYTYTGNNSDELPFTEGDQLSIIDMAEEEWWKTERGGVVFIVPAAYLEIVEAAAVIPNGSGSTITNEAVTASPIEVTKRIDPPSSTKTSGPADVYGEVGDDNGGDSDSDSSDYLSFDESDVEDSYPETKAEREARAHERQLVLRAAGLIVTQDDKPPPGVIRARSTKRRPAPTAPQRTSTISVSPTKELPPVPQPEPEPMDHARRLDDAFDRYESFKTSQGNRMSVASVDTIPPSPTISSFSGSITSQPKEGESRSYSHFLNFLGRTKTPDGERRTTLNISAPIISNSEDPSRTNSPAFGTSWASLVDKTALEGIPPGERRRQEAIFELINTEAAYVRDLQLIVEVFYSSMLPLLSQKEVTVVFANIEDILLTNTTFTSSLEERQKECRLYVDRIGDILLDHLPNMGVYMEYCVNQSTAIKVLKSLRESNPTLAAHLQRLRDSDPAVRNLDLSSYLLVPMQRITKYPLLIKQILHHTEGESERGSIENALHISEKLLDQINETIRDQEGRETLKLISQNLWIGQGRLDLTAPTRHMGPRKLIKEGALTKAKSGRKLYGFLCSDILVLTDESMKTLYRMPIPLAQARVKEVSPGKDDLTFQVAQAYPRGGDTIALKATSVRDCQVWMHEIEYAGRRCRHAEDRAARKHRK